MGINVEPLKISERMTFNLKNKKVFGHYGSSFDHVYELIRLASSGRLDLAPSIADHIALADASEAPPPGAQDRRSDSPHPRSLTTRPSAWAAPATESAHATNTLNRRPGEAERHARITTRHRIQR
ncbi:hypothetical protein OIE61_40735 [Streptomyces sp. NBC_01762]|uniref:hypothetical protein n=1 Tax=Streptomyces sp. NBC_01762 TaxID=2975933 RepID=UPI002DDC78F6|nr:hypothetical protein [Streptomyces sp. NBC_01762]WSC49718.1 hypothetical protein OIE61_40735 [Streptomyces sp. NBC_01762]